MGGRLPAVHLQEALQALASIRQPQRPNEPPLLTPRNVKRCLHLNNGEPEELLETLERLQLISAPRPDGKRVMFRDTWLRHRPKSTEAPRA